MIEIIEGIGVGSGKTYFTVKRLIEDHWRHGGTAYVMNTLHIKWDACKKLVERRYGLLLEDSQYHSITEDEVTRLFEHTPPGTPDCPLLIVIDECQGSLNARDWADKSKRDLFDWCTQSRHDCNDLWFISQSALNIDKQLRRLASYVWRVRNTKQWGSNIVTLMCGAMRLLSCGIHTGGFFIVSQLDQNNKTLIGRKKWLDQDADIFHCYETRSMAGKRSRKGNAVNRLKLARRQSRRPMIRYAVACALIAMTITGCNVAKRFMGKDKAKESTKRAEVAQKAETSYDIRSEVFRAQVETNSLKTDKWFYRVGDMSPSGYVQGIKSGVIRIQQANGRLLYIVTDKDAETSTSVSVQQTTPAKHEFQHEAIVIPDRGLFPPQSSPFTRDETPYSYNSTPAPTPVQAPSTTPTRGVILRGTQPAQKPHP